ncbi:MAG TPA: macrolide ABC transporter ATP-binding protein, partial [Geminicoccaceae bacterium]
EPTGALDTRTSQEIMSIFRRLNREDGLTIVLVTHEAEIAAHAGRIITFRDGRVVADGSHPPLSASLDRAAYPEPAACGLVA